METMDRIAMSKAVYAVIADRRSQGWPDAKVANAVTAAADGYAFPTNLDNDPPLDGLTPPSHAAIMAAALGDGDTADEFAGRVDALVARRRSR
jgi:hypothetical protein